MIRLPALEARANRGAPNYLQSIANLRHAVEVC